MKLTCNTYDLKAACAKAARVIDKSPSPATNGLMLSAESGVLTVTGYNLTIGISVKIPAMIEIPGAIIADAKILTNAAGRGRIFPQGDEIVSYGGIPVKGMGLPGGPGPGRTLDTRPADA